MNERETERHTDTDTHREMLTLMIMIDAVVVRMTHRHRGRIGRSYSFAPVFSCIVTERSLPEDVLVAVRGVVLQSSCRSREEEAEKKGVAVPVAVVV